MNTVAAIVVTYNRKCLLIENITALLNQTAIDKMDIIVVDNASTDGTEEAIQDYIKSGKVLYYNTGKNLGGAGGFNYGMKLSLQLDYKFSWIMDDDSIPKRDALERLLEADDILKENYGWLSCAVLWQDGHECKMNRQKIRKNYYEYMEYAQYSLISVEQATFVGLFLKNNVIKTVGFPIKDFFIWGDDIEYTRRICVRYQMPCFLLGKSIIVHKMNNNDGSDISIDKMERIDRYRFAYRNENYLYRQEGFKGIIYYVAKCMYNIYKIIISKSDNKLYRVWVLLMSVIKGFLFNPKIEKY